MICLVSDTTLLPLRFLGYSYQYVESVVIYTRFIVIGGCGQAFEAMIVSPQFSGKTSLARHRLVNSALREEIAAIHAWTPKCLTPEEWEKRQGMSAASS